MIIRRALITTLSLSATGLVGIVGHEGYRDQAYIPVKGDVATIGFGTTHDVKIGDTITPNKALGRALQDVSQFEGALRKCVTVPLHQSEYDAYISLTYNIGSTAFCSSTLVRKLNASDYVGACAQIKRWTYANGRQLQGLINRRADEYDQCMGSWYNRLADAVIPGGIGRDSVNAADNL